MIIKEIYEYLDMIAPFSSASEWDNTGLCVGTLTSDVKKVILSLDVTKDVIKKAVDEGAQLVLTHHPLIFDGVKSIKEGTVLYEAVKSGVTFISSHTCLDKAIGGVNTCLAEVIGIKNSRISELDEFLNLGEVEPVTVKAFAEKIKKSLDCNVSFTDSDKIIKKVAYCSGSGGDLVPLAVEAGADALLTGEAKYHEYLLAKDMGIALFTAGHFETENIVLDYLHNVLSEKFPDLEILVYSLKPIEYI